MRKKIFYSAILCLLILIIIAAKGDKQLTKINTNDHYNYIAVNECFMWVSNNGDGSHDPRFAGSGFYWPGGEDARIPAIYEDGLLFGGIVNGEIRVNGNTHRQGLQAGKILEDGLPDDPSKEKYRVYKIKKGWESLPLGPGRDKYEKDYNEWPVEDGAPWIDRDNDGIFTKGLDVPKIYGDEMLWYVANDMDTARSTFTFGTLPMGLEFQTTVFAFDKRDFRGNVVFKKYIMINKGEINIEDMYLSYWSDTDLGYVNDDFSGCDTTLDLSYTYNGDSLDNGFYELRPPAVGYKLLQGPVVIGGSTDSARILGNYRYGFINLRLTSFVFNENCSYCWGVPPPGIAVGPEVIFNNFNGYNWNGEPFVDPTTGIESKFNVPGDPVGKTGWYEGEGWPDGPQPGDRRHIMSSGPFNFAPGDTQEVVYAIIVAQGEDHIDSITKLRDAARKTQLFYDSYQPEPVESIEINPEYFNVSQNFPNPFNPETKFTYSLPTQQNVKVTVYDLIGREIEVLVNKEQEVGDYEITFDGSKLASGIYFYHFETPLYTTTKKMVLLK